MPEEPLSAAPSNGKLTLESGVDYAAALSACREFVVEALPSSFNAQTGTTTSSDDSSSSSSSTMQWMSVGATNMATEALFASI